MKKTKTILLMLILALYVTSTISAMGMGDKQQTYQQIIKNLNLGDKQQTISVDEYISLWNALLWNDINNIERCPDSKKKTNLIKDFKLYKANQRWDDYGNTSVFIAIFKNDTELLKKLIKFGADINTCRYDGISPLNVAIDSNNPIIIRELINAGASCNTSYSGDTYQNVTPLFQACMNSTMDKEILQLILDHTSDTNINMKTTYLNNQNYKFIFSPVQYLCFYYEENNLELIKNLIARGGDIKSSYSVSSYTDRDVYDTPLTLAIANKNYELAKLLLNYLDSTGINFKIKTAEEEYSALSLAMLDYKPQDSDTWEIITALIEKGADINARYNNIATPLALLVWGNNAPADKIRWMLDHGADPNISITTDSGTWTPLSLTCFNHIKNKDEDTWKSITALVEKGADINARFSDDDDNIIATPLSYLVDCNVPADKIRWMLDHGADPNIEIQCKTDDGKLWRGTILHYAAYNNNTELYNLLKEYGADINAKDSNNKIPLIYLAENTNNSADSLNILYEQQSGSGAVDISSVISSWDDKTTKEQQSILQIVIQNADDENALEILKNNRVDWKYKDLNGDNAFDYAFKSNRTKVINYFIDNKVNIGESILTVIDTTLKDGNTSYLSQFLSYDNYSNVTAKLGGATVDPIVYASLINNEDTTLSYNRNNIVKILLENKSKFTKAGLNSKIPQTGKYPIMSTDDEEIIMRLLEYGADYNMKDTDGFSAIDYAFQKNQEQVIRWLLEHKINIGESIFSAIDNQLAGHQSYISQFMQINNAAKGSKPVKTIKENNQLIQYGPVVYTAMARQDENSTETRKQIFDELLSSGYNINETVSGGDYSGNSALIFAAMNNNNELAKYLLEKGIDINITNHGNHAGRNALFYAIENKNFDLAQIIIQKMGSFQDIQLPDENITLFMIISQYGDPEFVGAVLKDLQSYDSILKKRDKKGWTPFLYAAAYNPDPEILKILRMYEADVTTTSTDGKNAADLAAENNPNKEDILDRLKTYGVIKK
ncbi:MAG: ankyrin repeat domain-containing protein [Spirochaetia bacterium]|nr:ankyrin repeat domain-containing protein [Spirochaetia bacterium]